MSTVNVIIEPEKKTKNTQEKMKEIKQNIIKPKFGSDMQVLVRDTLHRILPKLDSM